MKKVQEPIKTIGLEQKKRQAERSLEILTTKQLDGFASIFASGAKHLEWLRENGSEQESQ